MCPHAHRLAAQLQAHGERPIFQVGDVSVDLVRRIVKVGDNEVKLSPKEYEIPAPPVQHAGKGAHAQVPAAETLGRADRHAFLRVYVRQLRRKIEKDPERPRYLLTETGIGYRYRLRAPD